MKKENFQKELERRLEENKKLMEKPFIPGRVSSVASFVVLHLFYVVVVMSLLGTAVLFGGFSKELLRISKMILLLKI